MEKEKQASKSNKCLNQILLTTYEAACSKLSAINHGYYYDPYLTHFVKKQKRRTPLINKGYYARVASFRMYIDLFFKSLENVESSIQVVNIGAGLDTTFFWLTEKYKNVKYFELDLHDLLLEKARVINRVDKLKNFLIYDENDRNNAEREEVINCSNYKMVFADLNNWEDVEANLRSHSFNFNLPTLFLCECVLIYLEIESSDRLIQKFSELMKSTSCMMVYEQVNPETGFGCVMINYFKKKNIPLKSIYKYNNLQAQYNRYKLLGWNNVVVNDMNEIYDYHLDDEERNRVENLEMFDELEEWRLFHDHYFLLIAYNCYNGINLNCLQNFLSEKQNR